MLRRVRFVLVCALLSLVPAAAPAAAEECIEVGQVKYCAPV